MSLWKKKIVDIKQEMTADSAPVKAKEAEQLEIYYQSKLSEKKRYAGPDDHVNPYVAGVPLDYSFRKVEELSQLEYGIPREYRVGIPRKGNTEKYVSCSLWANYNNLTNLSSIDALVKISFEKPEGIAWLDVSFNQIQNVSDELLKLKNLKILYLHGNNIRFLMEIAKLKELKKLKTLTLHGNPIEEIPNYRLHVIKLIPHLINLDFSMISKDERIAGKRKLRQ